MSDLAPLETLYEAASGDALPLPAELEDLYGPLRIPAGGRHVVGNFVSTLDGVVTLGVPGHASGGAISGGSRHDRLVMGLLRSAADVVITGAGTLRSVPDHLWTAAYIYPDLSQHYDELRTKLGKSGPPLNVIVSASGKLDPEFRVLRSGEVPVRVITTAAGKAALGERKLASAVEVVVAGDGKLSTKAVLAAAAPDAAAAAGAGIILLEAGPRLMADFIAERLLDELFLTLSPQIAGRDGSTERPGFVAGRQFAPFDSRWGTLVGVKRGDSHLFLRYAFDDGQAARSN